MPLLKAVMALVHMIKLAETRVIAPYIWGIRTRT
jgi:hypothetical protein